MAWDVWKSGRWQYVVSELEGKSIIDWMNEDFINVSMYLAKNEKIS